MSEGCCPKCGMSVQYGSAGPDGEDYGYEWTCPSCGATGTEWHKMTFVEHTLDDPKDLVGLTVDVEPRTDDEFEHEFQGVVESYDEQANLLTVRDQDDDRWCVYPSQVIITEQE